MKKLILILMVFLISCLSPEKKIKNSFKNQRGNFKVESVQIYDTIFTETITENMEFFNLRIKYLENSIKMANEYRDSIRKLEYPELKEDSLLKLGAIWKRERWRDLETTSFKSIFTNILYSKMNDTIAGYYARIITQHDTINFIVDPTFQIICTESMYEIN